MLFTDKTFLFFFLPFALLLHRFALRNSPQGAYGSRARAVLFLLTLVFYGWHTPWWLIPFLASVGFDFLWARLIHESKNEKKRKAWMWTSVVQNLGLLAVFKYWNLIADGVAWMSPSVGAILPRHNLALPAGISFYTFESLSFVIDVYRRAVTPPRTRMEFLAFIGMFPRFIAGPIVRYKDLRNQFDNYGGMDVSGGLRVFILGLFRKACLADSFALFTGYAFDAHYPLDCLSAWLGVIAYTMQIYFDFSGYSLMAIGLGKCLGFQFNENFNQPYAAGSFKDFWRRWHISLSTWLRDYLYIPLGGDRKGPVRTYVNLFLTMVLGGLWHGASLTFVAWGAWHGGLLALERYTGFTEKMPKPLARVVTFLGVCIGWVFFRAKDFTEASAILGAMASPARNWHMAFNPSGLLVSPVAVFFCLAGLVYCFTGEGSWKPKRPVNPLAWDALPLAVAALSLLVLFSNQVIPFLYFQF